MTQHTVIRSTPFYKGVTAEFTSPTKAKLALTYTPGSSVAADGINLDPDDDCGQGINFCQSIADALRWGPKVVEILVPSGVKVVDTGGKLRAARVKVGREVYLTDANLARANLADANLTGANLARADLAGANLTGANLTGAQGNRHTTLPAGYEVNASGLIVRSK